MTAQKKTLRKSTIIWLSAVVSALVGIAVLLIWLLSSFYFVGGRLYDKDEYFVTDGTAYSNAEYFELDGKAYDFATYFEIDGVAYDYESSFEFEGASYPKSEYFTAGDRLYDFATYFCLNDTAYAHADYFLLRDTAYDRAEWFEHENAAYKHSEYYVAYDRLYEIKEITLGGKTFMSDITELELRDCGITDISVLADCGKLEKLDLGSDWNGTGNTNRIEDISALSELYGLKYLDLSANKISDVSPLTDLKQLEKLDLELNKITDISALAGLTNLKSLDVSGNYQSGLIYFLDINPLSCMVELTHLDISDNPVVSSAGGDLCALGNLTELVSLDISSINFAYQDLAHQGKAPMDISSLSELVKLERLSMSVNASVIGIEPLSGMKELTYLNMYSTRAMDEDYSYLSELTKLVHLNLGYCSVRDITPLSNLYNLEYLCLLGSLGYDENSGLSALKDISALSGLTKLMYLNINDAELDDVTPLSGLHNLRYLTVPWSLSEEQLITIRSALPDCELYHSDNKEMWDIWHEI